MTENPIVIGRKAKLHLWLLRQAARTGHIRRASLALGRLFGAGSATMALPNGGVITVSLQDPYWARLLVGFDYEPEVEAALDRLLVPGSTYLIDCGANIGYWSSRFSHRVPVVAVEANPVLFEQLKLHAVQNGFTAIQGAVWSNAGETLDFGWSPLSHAGGGVGNIGSDHAQVQTLTIDDLHAQYGGGLRPVIKLDVEGAEIAALKGGRRALSSGWLIYEDHANDPLHAVSSWLIANGAEVSILPDQGDPTTIASVEDLDDVKTISGKGYNFLAQMNDTWSR